MTYLLLSLLNKVFPVQRVLAHCDIPCGIYTPEPAITAAQTVARMAELIENPPFEIKEGDAVSARNFHNAMTRYVLVKEEHAEKCKRELLILWTDYFTPEHLKKFPNLHDTFWKATKLCSANKQQVSSEKAKELQAAVQEIADIFIESKK